VTVQAASWVQSQRTILALMGYEVKDMVVWKISVEVRTDKLLLPPYQEVQHLFRMALQPFYDRHGAALQLANIKVEKVE
jgi:hypothetical protein